MKKKNSSRGRFKSNPFIYLIKLLRLFKDAEFTLVKASKRSTVFKYSKEYRKKLYKSKLQKRKAKIEKT